jgi:hypothetical protein
MVRKLSKKQKYVYFKWFNCITIILGISVTLFNKSIFNHPIYYIIIGFGLATLFYEISNLCDIILKSDLNGK